MNALDLINKRLAAPKAFRVVTTYDNGTIRTHDTETKAQAENWASLERAKLNRTMIDRNSGDSVTRVSVAVETL